MPNLALRAALKAHAWWLVIGALALFAGRSWLAEHDARLLAQQAIASKEASIKASEQRVSDLEAVRAADEARWNDRLKELASRKVDTPKEALPLIRDYGLKVTPVAPNMQDQTLLPDAPSEVRVDTVELAKALKQCELDHAGLGKCQASLDAADDVAKEQQAQLDDRKAQVEALKRGPGFWKQLGRDFRSAAIGALALEVGRKATTGRW